MVKKKYVVLSDDKKEFLILFDEEISHKEAADGVGMRPVSAGFVLLDRPKLHCYGYSPTLGLESRGAEDTELLSRFLSRR